jgi:hypothetical protein
MLRQAAMPSVAMVRNTIVMVTGRRMIVRIIV